MTKTVLYPLIATGVIALTCLGRLNAQQSRGEAISIGTDHIGGVVTGESCVARLELRHRRIQMLPPGQ
jgi:hypothetical protein